VHLQRDQCTDGQQFLCPSLIGRDGFVGQDQLVPLTLLKVGRDVREYNFVGSDWVLDSSGPFEKIPGDIVCPSDFINLQNLSVIPTLHGQSSTHLTQINEEMFLGNVVAEV